MPPGVDVLRGGRHRTLTVPSLQQVLSRPSEVNENGLNEQSFDAHNRRTAPLRRSRERARDGTVPVFGVGSFGKCHGRAGCFLLQPLQSTGSHVASSRAHGQGCVTAVLRPSVLPCQLE